MKIALLATGQCRQLWLTAPSLNKFVVEPNNADIFLYLNTDSMEPLTGSDEESIVKSAFPNNVKSLIFTDDNYRHELKELIQSNYEKIDTKYKELGRDKWDKQLNHHNTCQYLKLKKCAESAVKYATENNFKYDLMIRMRPDIGWLNSVDLLRPITPNTLYVNYSQYNVSATSDSKFVPWVEDTHFFGDQSSMLRFCSAFSENMVSSLDICAEEYDLTFATEKLLARVLLNSGIPYTGINDYFGYTGNGWIRPKLGKYFTNWAKSENFHLVEKYCNGATSGLAVYFDRIGNDNIVMDPTLIL